MRLTQALVYTRKFYRTQKKDSIISIAIAIIISLVVVWTTGEDMFDTYEATKSGFFCMVSACIWVGIFNSIQLICREKRDIVKDELDKGLYATSYIGAHFIFQFVLCLIQAIIMLIIYSGIDFPSDGVIFGGSTIEYFITIFLLLYAADTLALIISAAVPTPVMAMTIMPLVLILQLVMCGVLFELKGAAETFANITISKWGMAAMGSIGNMNDEDLLSKTYDIFESMGCPQMYSRETEDIYESTSGHLGNTWLILVAFSVVSYFISVASLKLTTKKLTK